MVFLVFFVIIEHFIPTFDFNIWNNCKPFEHNCISFEKKPKTIVWISFLVTFPLNWRFHTKNRFSITNYNDELSTCNTHLKRNILTLWKSKNKCLLMKRNSNRILIIVSIHFKWNNKTLNTLTCAALCSMRSYCVYKFFKTNWYDCGIYKNCTPINVAISQCHDQWMVVACLSLSPN